MHTPPCFVILPITWSRGGSPNFFTLTICWIMKAKLDQPEKSRSTGTTMNKFRQSFCHSMILMNQPLLFEPLVRKTETPFNRKVSQKPTSRLAMLAFSKKVITLSQNWETKVTVRGRPFALSVMEKFPGPSRSSDQILKDFHSILRKLSIPTSGHRSTTTGFVTRLLI